MAFHAVQRSHDNCIRPNLISDILQRLPETGHLRGDNHQIGGIPLFFRRNNVKISFLSVDNHTVPPQPVRAFAARYDSQTVPQFILQPVGKI